MPPPREGTQKERSTSQSPTDDNSAFRWQQIARLQTQPGADRLMPRCPMPPSSPLEGRKKDRIVPPPDGVSLSARARRSSSLIELIIRPFPPVSRLWRDQPRTSLPQCLERCATNWYGLDRKGAASATLEPSRLSGHRAIKRATGISNQVIDFNIKTLRQKCEFSSGEVILAFSNIVFWAACGPPGFYD
ncbi:MAG: hypothetical protein JWR80_10205 [Bradyrhizobium sp.]|nr:hypothetical protein [Bradyrhizobium sp.]